MVGKLHSPALERFGHDDEPRQKVCEWPDCTEEGQHRAPRSRDEMNSYRWFCRDHAREYNKQWNYFAGMSDVEVEADRRADTVWRRPSWPLGDGPPSPEHARAFQQGDFADPFNVFSGARDRGPGPGPGPEENTDPVMDGDVRRALAIFGMERPASVDEVKARYKALVKRHHPDATKGCADDERIKDINQAYQVILAFLAP